MSRMITKDSAKPKKTAAGRPPSPPRRSSDLERAAAKLLAANGGLRQHLESYDQVIRQGLEKYGAGMRIQDVVKMMPPSDATIGSDMEVMEVFEARREFRKYLVGALLADGMAVDEIAATFKASIESICDLAVELGINIE